MIKVVESADTIEVQALMPIGQRALFAALALIPLIAPYELILRINWQSYLNLFFLLALIISLGATALSAFLIWAAVAGLSSTLKFDKAHRILAYAFGAPIVPWRAQQYPLDALQELRVEKTEWSEGSPSFTLMALLQDGRTLKSASSWSESEIETIRQQVAEFLLEPAGASKPIT